nr:polysaccharide deacetylase family protein [Clostridium cadaveris]
MREFFKEKKLEKNYIIIIFILLFYNMLSIELYLYLNLRSNTVQASEIEDKVDKPINEGVVEQPLRYRANEDEKVFLEDVYKNDGKKTAYLTFDDGPSNYVTSVILDILDKYNIKATFLL